MCGIVWAALRSVGGLLFSLFYIRQTDSKSLIACFSVSQISIKQLMNKQIPKNHYCLKDTGLLGCDSSVVE
jgi:hypothetical protein